MKTSAIIVFVISQFAVSCCFGARIHQKAMQAKAARKHSGTIQSSMEPGAEKQQGSQQWFTRDEVENMYCRLVDKCLKGSSSSRSIKKITEAHGGNVGTIYTKSRARADHELKVKNVFWMDYNNLMPSSMDVKFMYSDSDQATGQSHIDACAQYAQKKIYLMKTKEQIAMLKNSPEDPINNTSEDDSQGAGFSPKMYQKLFLMLVEDCFNKQDGGSWGTIYSKPLEGATHGMELQNVYWMNFQYPDRSETMHVTVKYSKNDPELAKTHLEICTKAAQPILLAEDTQQKLDMIQ